MTISPQITSQIEYRCTISKELRRGGRQQSPRSSFLHSTREKEDHEQRAKEQSTRERFARLAARLFTSELRSLLQDLPLPLRGRVLAAIQKSLPSDSPEKKLLLLRNLEKTITGTKQLIEHQIPWEQSP